MTVAELIAVLSELDPTRIVAVEIAFRHGDNELLVANDKAYQCTVEYRGETVDAVALSVPGD